ncbi:MAG: Smr/MutS family protein [Spirochaetaceae bacterium]
MDFGEILESWERQGSSQRPDKKREDSNGTDSPAHSALKKWLESEEVWESIHQVKEEHQEEHNPPRRAALRKMAPQDILDLHGKKTDEAKKLLHSFLVSARNRELKKVLIIHGKGNHSTGEPVLKNIVVEYLRKCTFTGETGTPGRQLGGSGATWVILKR